MVYVKYKIYLKSRDLPTREVTIWDNVASVDDLLYEFFKALRKVGCPRKETALQLVDQAFNKAYGEERP